jgi:tetratricopeptide (TPR) repeat protein
LKNLSGFPTFTPRQQNEYDFMKIFWCALVLQLISFCNLNAQDKYTKDQQIDVINECNDRLLKDSTNSELYLARAEAEYVIGDTIHSLVDFSKGIKFNAHNAQAFYDRGVIFFQLNKLSNAEKDFKTAINLNKRFPQAYCYLGIVYQYNGLMDKAINCFSQAIKDSNNYADAYNDRALCYKNQINYLTAINDFDKAIKIYDTLKVYDLEGNAYLNKAYCYAKLRRKDSAETIINYLYKIDSTNAATLEYKGLISIESNNLKVGCYYLNEAKLRGSQDAADSLKKYCK